MDTQLRTLERDAEARASALRQRLRSGEAELAELRFAAYCGDELAKAALAERAPEVPSEPEAWVRGLQGLGPEAWARGLFALHAAEDDPWWQVPVRVASMAALRALVAHFDGRSSPAQLREVLDALSQSTPYPGYRERLLQHALRSALGGQDPFAEPISAQSAERARAALLRAHQLGGRVALATCSLERRASERVRPRIEDGSCLLVLGLMFGGPAAQTACNLHRGVLRGSSAWIAGVGSAIALGLLAVLIWGYLDWTARDFQRRLADRAALRELLAELRA